MFEARAESAGSSSRQPPLAISHLMLWILGAATVLGVYRAYGAQGEAPPLLNAVLVGNQLVFSLLAGINIAAVIIFARRLAVRDAPLLVQPGHWLLALAGVSNVAAWVVIGSCSAIAWLRAADPGFAETPPYHWLGYSVASLLSLALNQVAAVAIREPFRWRLFFVVSGLSSAALGLTFGLMFVFSMEVARANQLYTAARWYGCLYPLDQIATIVFLGFNLVADRVDRCQRDWLHVVGMATTLLQSIAAVLLQWLLAWASAATQ